MTRRVHHITNGRTSRQVAAVCCAAVLLLSAGCGTMKSQQATEQLLLSDAVDQSIAGIDFRVLAGQKVYLDTTYVQPIKGSGFVNADYIISSLRQQMFAARCLLQEKREEADFIVEARVGALGSDAHDVTYGLPATSALSTAATLVPNSPPLPLIPEIAVAKRNDNQAAAKVAVFAYHRESRLPVWQSGVAVSRSRAKDVWVLGAGPFQHGTIYDSPQFAGASLHIPLQPAEEEQPAVRVDFHEAAAFDKNGRPISQDDLLRSVRLAEFEDTDEPASAADSAAENRLSDDPPAQPRRAVPDTASVPGPLPADADSPEPVPSADAG